MWPGGRPLNAGRTTKDLDTAWRGQSAAGPLQRVIQLAGTEATRAAREAGGRPVGNGLISAIGREE